MPLPENAVEIPTYFAAGAFAATRIDYEGIYYNPDVVAAAAAFLQTEYGKSLPGEPTDVTYVYRFGEPGYRRPEPDPSFERANPSTPYVPAAQLAVGAAAQFVITTKAQIQAMRRPIMQVDLQEGQLPSMTALAKSVVYPPAEDVRMNAGPLAWVQTVGDSLRPSRSVGNRERIIKEVAARFAGGIILNPRRQHP